MKNIFLIIILVMTLSNSTFGQSNKLVTDLSITHLIKKPASYDANNTQLKYPLVIALHGHGSNEEDLISLSSHLPDELFWVSGRGPQTLNEGSYDWYQLPPTPQKISETLKLIEKFITELITTYPIDPDKIYLLGFSQGSMIALSHTMAYPQTIAGVIAQSGAIPSDIGIEIDTAGLKGKPIIITHGTEDRAMPISKGRETRDILLNFGADVTYHEFIMGHTISNESLAVVKKWLSKEL